MAKDFSFEECRFGIEHEFAVIGEQDVLCDFSNSTFEDFGRVILDLPVIESDYPGLRVGDLGIKAKRWYIEGFERFSQDGDYLLTNPKGFEIRTPICMSLDEAVTTLTSDFKKWQNAASKYGYTSARTSFNPFQESFIPHPPLNTWEIAHRATPEEKTAYIHMLTYGPDISFSHPDWSEEMIVDIAKKLTFYSPYIIPYSFSSPFYKGELWGGLSRRTFYRTRPRPAALVFLSSLEYMLQTSPSLTEIARIPLEAGRIEFKAFDTFGDLSLYKSLGTLLLGLGLDETLLERSLVPDASLHQRSATYGFDDPVIVEGAKKVLDAAHDALPEHMRMDLDRLREQLKSRTSPAQEMIDVYKQTGSIMEAITLPSYG